MLSGCRAKWFKGNSDSVFLVPCDAEDGEALFSLLNQSVSILSIDAEDWDQYLSPWPSEKVFKGGRDFGGKADLFLQDILKIQKSMSQEMPDAVWGIAGYSLAGLFALYAGTETDLFQNCASVSGSMWYPDFITYLENYPVHAQNVYLSLGDTEANSRSPVLSTVETCTEKAYQILKKQTQHCIFEMNSGGHFAENNERTAKGIRWLIHQTEEKKK